MASSVPVSASKAAKPLPSLPPKKSTQGGATVLIKPTQEIASNALSAESQKRLSAAATLKDVETSDDADLVAAEILEEGNRLVNTAVNKAIEKTAPKVIQEASSEQIQKVRIEIQKHLETTQTFVRGQKIDVYLEHARQALALAKEKLSPLDPLRGECLLRLKTMYRNTMSLDNQKQSWTLLAEAKEFYTSINNLEKVLEICEELLKVKDGITKIALLEEMVTFNEKLYGPDHLKTGWAYFHLWESVKKSKDQTRCIEVVRKMKAICDKREESEETVLEVPQDKAIFIRTFQKQCEKIKK